MMRKRNKMGKTLTCVLLYSAWNKEIIGKRRSEIYRQCVERTIGSAAPSYKTSITDYPIQETEMGRRVHFWQDDWRDKTPRNVFVYNNMYTYNVLRWEDIAKWKRHRLLICAIFAHKRVFMFCRTNRVCLYSLQARKLNFIVSSHRLLPRGIFNLQELPADRIFPKKTASRSANRSFLKNTPANSNFEVFDNRTSFTIRMPQRKQETFYYMSYTISNWRGQPFGRKCCYSYIAF